MKSVYYPLVGDLDLTFQGMDLVSDRGQQMLVSSAGVRISRRRAASRKLGSHERVHGASHNGGSYGRLILR